MTTNNAVNISSAGLVRYDGLGTFTGVTVTNHSVLIGAASNGITSVALTNGQLLIGSTGVDPVAGSLTSTGSTIAITTGSGTINLETDGSVATSYLCDDTNSAIPAAGVLTVSGASVAAGTDPVATSAAGSTVTINVQTSQALAATDATKIGLCNFDSSMFSVDANGFVTLIGGSAGIDSFQPDSGTNPVVPDGTGLVVMAGSGSITTVGGLNTLTTQLTGLTNHSLQVGAGTSTLTQLAVGTDGQVLLGATGADPAFATLTSTGGTITFTPGVNALNLETDASIATSYTGDSGSAVPALGVLTVIGGTVPAGTSPIATAGASSTITINSQISQALAATDATKIGLSNFDSTYFSVDANGFVTISGAAFGETITGDSGGALSPSSGNWNILGTGGITTSGSGSTLSIDGSSISTSMSYKLSFMFGGM